MSDKPVKYHVVGEFVGGCWWESVRKFDSKQEALDWWKANAGPTPSRNVHVEEVSNETK